MNKCSYCGGAYERSLSVCPPFCSERCQQLDLRNWLNESYGLPFEDQSRPEELVPADEQELEEEP